MAITLAHDSLSDAEVTDGIGRGDLASAARLWVRHWSTALSTARLYVERAEVPGLAAEALIGTISMTALGRGPREDVAGFVTSAVRELGEDDEPVVLDTDAFPDVYVSPRLTRSFADLHAEDQELLRDLAFGVPRDEQTARALTVLQTSYLTGHLDEAPTRDCRSTHVALIAAAEQRADTFSNHHWLHMSTCAWCTEAFHELAFSNIALDALLAPTALSTAIVAPESMPEEVAAPVVAAVIEEAEPSHLEPAGGVLTLLRGGRNRLLTVVALTAAVALVAVVLSQNLSGNEDPTSPSAASNAQPTAESTATGGNDAGILGSLEETPWDVPTATVAGPMEIATPKATKTPTASATKPASKPTKTPSSSPSAPATSAPPTNAPAPTPTPTKTCNPLQHLLGFC